MRYGPCDERIERLAAYHGVKCTQCTFTNISIRERKLVQEITLNFWRRLQAIAHKSPRNEWAILEDVPVAVSEKQTVSTQNVGPQLP